MRLVAGERATTGGVAFDDAYRWLTNDSPETLRWQQAQDELAQAALAEGGRVARFESLFGEAFWRAGRMADKPNTFEDLYGVLRDLVRRGVTTVAQLGIFGTSNGGVLVSAAIAQRPELFAAGVAQVPLVDLHEIVRDPLPLSIAAADAGHNEMTQAQFIRRDAEELAFLARHLGLSS